MRHFILSLIILLTFGVNSCSKNENSSPMFRVRNDRPTDANVQIKTSGGNTININNVKSGTTTAYQDVAAGQVDITVLIQGVAGSYLASFVAQTNQTFTIVVSNTTPPLINVISP